MAPVPMPLTSYIEFQGIRGTRAGRHQYAAVWSVDMVLRMTDESLLRTIEEAVELIDDGFIKDLANIFMLGEETAFPQPILLGVFGRIEFLAVEPNSNLGAIRMDPANRVEILDGLHRLAALRSAALGAQRAAELSIPVLITPVSTPAEFAERRAAITRRHPANGAARLKRMINKTIHREIAKDSVALSPFLTRAVDLSSATLSLRSNRLFTLTTYARACSTMLGAGVPVWPAQDAAQYLATYWQHLGDLLLPWNRLASNRVAASELRESTVLANSSLLGALALLGAHVLSAYPDDWKPRLQPLADMEWGRDNPQWRGLLSAGARLPRRNHSLESAYRILLNACGLATKDAQPPETETPFPPGRSRILGRGPSR